MKNTPLAILIAASVAASVPAMLYAQAQTDGSDEDFLLRPADISVEDGVLYFVGDISDASWQKLSALSDGGATQGISHMVITSPGGDTRAGRQIGRWVHENIALLEVEGMCFSSCANYVFPVADQKIIRQDGFVGWHGTERTSEILALSQPDVTAQELERKELRAAMLASRPDLEGTAELETLLVTELDRAASSRIDEAAYFADLGVDDTLAYFGILPGQLPEYMNSGAAGWTYSLEDMACFGVENVTYAGAGSYHKSTAVQANVHVFDLAKECE